MQLIMGRHPITMIQKICVFSVLANEDDEDDDQDDLALPPMEIFLVPPALLHRVYPENLYTYVQNHATNTTARSPPAR